MNTTARELEMITALIGELKKRNFKTLGIMFAICVTGLSFERGIILGTLVSIPWAAILSLPFIIFNCYYIRVNLEMPGISVGESLDAAKLGSPYAKYWRRGILNAVDLTNRKKYLESIVAAENAAMDNEATGARLSSF